MVLDEAGGIKACGDDEAASRKLRRQALAAQRKLQRVQHRVSVLVWVARGLSMDGAADCAAVQAAMLSLAEGTLVTTLAEGFRPQLSTVSQQQVDSSAIEKAALWMRQSFEVCDAEDQAWGPAQEACMEEVRLLEDPVGDRLLPPATLRAAAQLLLCVPLAQGTEEQLAALFVALLRAHGVLARFTSALQVRIPSLAPAATCATCASPCSPLSDFASAAYALAHISTARDALAPPRCMRSHLRHTHLHPHLRHTHLLGFPAVRTHRPARRRWCRCGARSHPQSLWGEGRRLRRRRCLRGLAARKS